MSTSHTGPRAGSQFSNGDIFMPPQSQFSAPTPAQQFMSPRVSQGDLLRKEQALGVIREIAPPEDHIGLQMFPFLQVKSDNVIFDYTKGLTTGLAPARAENAESELAQKESNLQGQGSASIIDWAIKDYYDANDVQRHRDFQTIAQQVADGYLPLSLQGDFNDLPAKQAMDQALRTRKLHNRIEKLIMDSLGLGEVGYNDGKIKFGINWERPANQQDQAPASGAWTSDTHDPINDFLAVKRFMYNKHGVRLGKVLGSNRAFNAVVNSSKWGNRAGFAPGSGVTNADLPYILNGWGPNAAMESLMQQTQLQPIEYDSGYRTGVPGTGDITFNRYLPDDILIFLPDDSQIAELDTSPIGFGKVLTSPHVMGNNTPGFYEWTQDTVDPWGESKGTGIKALPVFPHMEMSYVMKLDLPPEA